MLIEINGCRFWASVPEKSGEWYTHSKHNARLPLYLARSELSQNDHNSWHMPVPTGEEMVVTLVWLSASGFDSGKEGIRLSEIIIKQNQTRHAASPGCVVGDGGPWFEWYPAEELLRRISVRSSWPNYATCVGFFFLASTGAREEWGRNFTECLARDLTWLVRGFHSSIRVSFISWYL